MYQYNRCENLILDLFICDISIHRFENATPRVTCSLARVPRIESVMSVCCCQRETCALFYCHLCKSLCLAKCGFVFSSQSDVVLDRGSSLIFFFTVSPAIFAACSLFKFKLFLSEQSCVVTAMFRFWKAYSLIIERYFGRRVTCRSCEQIVSGPNATPSSAFFATAIMLIIIVVGIFVVNLVHLPWTLV